MNESIKGRIHQVESFGSVDGPGVRYIVLERRRRHIGDSTAGI